MRLTLSNTDKKNEKIRLERVLDDKKDPIVFDSIDQI